MPKGQRGWDWLGAEWETFEGGNRPLFRSDVDRPLLFGKEAMVYASSQGQFHAPCFMMGKVCCRGPYILMEVGTPSSRFVWGQGVAWHTYFMNIYCMSTGS